MRFSSVRIAWIKKHSEMSAICESKSLLWQSSRPMLFAFFEHDFYVSSYLIYFQAFDEAHAGIRCHKDIPSVTFWEKAGHLPSAFECAEIFCDNITQALFFTIQLGKLVILG